MTTTVKEENRNVHHGFNIMIARTIMKYTQEGLANEIQVTPRKMHELEKMAVIDDDILIKIAKVLKIDVDFLRSF